MRRRIGERAYGAYAALKDLLFDLAYGKDRGAASRAAGAVLDRLPVTRTERELIEMLFG